MVIPATRASKPKHLYRPGKHHHNWLCAGADNTDVLYGITNTLLCGVEVPLSVFVGIFIFANGRLIIGTNVTLNFIVLFALLFGLGIIVDDAIVVIENTHRIYANGKVPIVQ